MKPLKAKSIVYLGGPAYKYEKLEPLLEELESRFREFISSLLIQSPSGRFSTIIVTVDIFNPESARAYARRLDQGLNNYEIVMSAGLSHYVWIASRMFSSLNVFPRWSKGIRIKNKKFQRVGRGSMLADYAHSIASYFILFHEISHIILGHCDYVVDVMKREKISEFGGEVFSGEEALTRKAFEVEADRLAGEFAAALFDESLGPDNKGIDLVFPSRMHAIEFYVYVVTIVCKLLEQLSAGTRGGVHPAPHERQLIICSALYKYLHDNYPEDRKILAEASVRHMHKAAKRFGLRVARDKTDSASVSLGLSFVDDLTSETDILRYTHRCTKASVTL